MKRLLVLILLLNFSFVKAQNQEILSSDRPGQALSSSVVGNHVFQIQTGIDFSNENSIFLPSSYFRYGLSERFEINSGFIFSGSNFAENLSSLSIGARYLVSNSNNKMQSSFQFSYDFKAEENIGQLVYILGSSFNEKLSYTANLGINFTDNLSLANTFYVFNVTYSINNKIGLFAENFGALFTSNYQFNFDTGVYYLLNNNFQLDTVIGDNDGFFIGAGFTWRVQPKK